VKVRQGDRVQAGQTLVTVDLDLVRDSKKSLISTVVFMNGQTVKLLKTGAVARGEADIVKL
ncbi:MAG: PTS glucose transporter subunit IIA, partial [Clostridium sp.]|nr:PTS glucose transporter subunit IIA [Clostridium sp.]